MPHVRALGIDTPVIPIPNGIDAAATPDQAPEAFVRLIDDLRARGRRVLGYAGGMTTANAINVFGLPLQRS